MNFRPFRATPTITALAAALVVLALSSCGGTVTLAPTIEIQATPSGGTPPEQSGENTAPTATQAARTPAPTATPADVQGALPEDLKGVQIDFWHPWQGDVAARAAEAVAEFNRSNEWGVRVQVQPFYGASALADAVNPVAAEADGDLPDVVAASSAQIAAWAEGDAPLAADLAPYAADGRVGLSEAENEAYNPIFWAQDQQGTRRLGLPALRGARVLLYNRTWAKELGFDEAPQTPDEFKAQACAAAQANNAARSVELYGTGGWLIDSDPLTTLSWLGAFGADPIPQEEGQPYAFQSAESEAALEFLRGMVTDGCAWIGRSLDSHEYFALRRALFTTGSLNDLYDQQGWQDLAQNEDEWTVLAFPGVDGEPVVYSAGDSYAVTAADPEERLAGWLFARWMSQTRVAASLAEALPSLPVSQAVTAQFAEPRADYPWNQILPLMDGLRPAPSLASWRLVRRLLEDAGWQVYHLPPESLEELLPQLDQAVQEMIAEPGD